MRSTIAPERLFHFAAPRRQAWRPTNITVNQSTLRFINPVIGS
jgi:hypothetical protein